LRYKITSHSISNNTGIPKFKESFTTKSRTDRACTVLNRLRETYLGLIRRTTVFLYFIYIKTI
jgi:hypothetical protein